MARRITDPLSASSFTHTQPTRSRPLTCLASRAVAAIESNAAAEDSVTEPESDDEIEIVSGPTPAVPAPVSDASDNDKTDGDDNNDASSSHYDQGASKPSVGEGEMQSESDEDGASKANTSDNGITNFNNNNNESPNQMGDPKLFPPVATPPLVGACKFEEPSGVMRDSPVCSIGDHWDWFDREEKGIQTEPMDEKVWNINFMSCYSQLNDLLNS